MAFGIGRDRNLERRDGLEARHQLRRAGIALRVRLIRRAGHRRIAAQGNDVADARRPIFGGDGVHLPTAGADAGEVSGGVQTGFTLDPHHCGVGTLAG
jgi:hypothetical protein